MHHRFVAASLALAVGAAQLHAQAITPVGTATTRPAGYFTSSVPTSNVFYNTVNGVELALSATQRFNNPAVTTNNQGTYYAQSGAYGGAGADAGYAIWNFDFKVSGDAEGQYAYRLLYDFDPASGTQQPDHGAFDIGSSGVDSWNLGMGFLTFNIGTLIDAPTYPAFNPNVAGSYTFALVQYTYGPLPEGEEIGRPLGEEQGRVAIDVEVTNVSATPEPASLALLGTGLVGIGAVVRRRRRA